MTLIYISLHLWLYRDASFRGLWAVLSQVQEGLERVITYCVLNLIPTERYYQNYSYYKLELLRLKWEVTEKSKPYLW